jgi:hypothetical protein
MADALVLSRAQVEFLGLDRVPPIPGGGVADPPLPVEASLWFVSADGFVHAEVGEVVPDELEEIVVREGSGSETH